MQSTKAYAAHSATTPLVSSTIPRREPTASDVEIEILFCGVCHSDLHTVRNEWSSVMPTVYPVVPGHEIIGRVTRVGAAVQGHKVGDVVGVGCLVGSDGTWSATIPVASFPYGDNPHTVTFYAPEANVASARMHFRSNTEFDGTLVHADDPAGDDTGPAGTYFYPSDATFQGAHYGDIVGVDLEASGATLRLKLHMADHSTTWNPSNGYDHVSFSLYFDLPGVDGVTVLPKLQAEAPEGFAWDISAFEFGWTNAFYKSDGATATEWGTPSPGRPKIAVDALRIPASPLSIVVWA